MKGKKKSYELIPPRLYPYIIAVFVFLLFGNTIFNDYSLDDKLVTVTNAYIHDNPKIEKGIAGIPDLFVSRYFSVKTQSFGYRPLTLTTFALEYQFLGSNPYFNHLINVLIYAFTCLLLLNLLKSFSNGKNLLFSFVVVLFFIAHPLHTEVVASIKNRDELMCFFFGLGSIYFSLKFFDLKKIKYAIYTVVMLWCAFMSKETAIVLLLIIPLTIYFFRPAVNFRKYLLPIAIIVVSVITFYIFKKLLLEKEVINREYVFIENPMCFNYSRLERIPTGLLGLLYYLKLLVIPFPMSAYYGWNTIPVISWASPFFWISFMIFLSLTGFALYLLPKKKMIAYTILFFLISIAPFSNIFQLVPGIIGERLAYFASLGFCLALVCLIFIFFKIPMNVTSIKKIKTTCIAFMLIILCIYSVLTINRNSNWKNIITLFRHDVKYYDESFNIHDILANAIGNRATYTPAGIERDKLNEESHVHYLKISEMIKDQIDKYPDDYILWNYMGTVQDKILNQTFLARKYYKQSLAGNPDNCETYYNLGLNYEKTGTTDSAISCYEKAITMKCENYMFYVRLHEIYYNIKEYDKAEEVNRNAIVAFPQSAVFYINLGNIRLVQKDTLDGIDYYMMAVDKEPANTNIKNQIISYLEKAGFTDKAETLKKKYP